ncbi:MAG: hypothetical protein CMO55_28470 [Verrucomicrobiales bacterium]|nr:hypothetical protein [Verrucomicrobiales bacterium]
MKRVIASRRKEDGFALLLVLVTVMALSLIIAGLWESSQPSWEANNLERARYKAGVLAESGLTIGLHPDIEPGDVALQQELSPGLSFEVRITSEGGKIPVNGLDDDILREATEEMFIAWGADAATASQAADSIADWVDEDSEVLPNGAENAYYAGLDYPQFPPNTAISNLEELLFVAGMDEIARIQPLWRDYFTFRSDDLIDLNAAPWELIMALTGCTEDSAMNFVAVRSGDDGEDNTPDDYRYEDTGEIQALLGLTDGEWSDISSLVTLSGAIKRIESTGRIGDFEETRVVLARESEQNGRTILTPVARFRE